MLLHLPEMRMMHFLNTVDFFDGRDDLVRVDIGRASQHQGADRVADLAEGEPEDIGGNPDGDRRIDPADIVEQDENATDDHGHGRQRIAEVVEEQRADVHAALLHRIGQPRG